MNDRQALDRKHEIKVGLTVLVAIAILVFAILTVGQNRGILADRYQLVVNMSRVNGLQTGAPVRLAGVRVGTVIRVDFPQDIEDQKIEVVLEIDKKVQPRIRRDSYAHIGTLGLLGDKYVGITMGSLEEPILKNGELLDSSDPLDVEKLLDEGVDVFAGLKRATQTINEIGDKINTGKGTLGKLVNDPRMYFDLDRLLLLTEKLAAAMDRGEGTIARLFNDPLLYANINEFLESSTQLVEALRSDQGTVGRLLQNDSLYTELTSAVSTLNSLSKNVSSGQGSLGKAMKEEVLYDDLRRITAEVDSLLKDVRRNPQRYLKVEIF